MYIFLKRLRLRLNPLLAVVERWTVALPHYFQFQYTLSISVQLTISGSDFNVFRRIEKLPFVA